MTPPAASDPSPGRDSSGTARAAAAAPGPNGGATSLAVSTFSKPSPVLVAEHLGLFEAEGLDVTYAVTSGSREQIAELAAGKWDLAHTNADNIMRSVQRGPDGLRVVGVIDLGISQQLLARSDVLEPSALRGQPVAVDAPDSGYAFVLYDLLQKLGLEADSYEVVAVGATRLRLEALREGVVAAGLLSHGYAVTAQAEGLRILADAKDHYPEYPGITVAARASWAEGNAGAVRAYLRALGTATRWVADDTNRDEAVEVIAARKAVDHEEAEQLLEREIEARSVPTPTRTDVRRGLEVVSQLRGAATGDHLEVERFFDDRYLPDPGESEAS